MRNQVDEKRRLLQAISANVSSEGQRLFIAISKMFDNNEVRWNNSDIIVLDEVSIITLTRMFFFFFFCKMTNKQCFQENFTQINFLPQSLISY